MIRKRDYLLLACLTLAGLIGCASTAAPSHHLQPEQYFAKGLLESDPQLDQLQRNWYGSMLAAMNEPVLTAIDKPPNYFALRILFLPTWGHPVVIRYEGHGTHGTYRAVELTGQGGYSPGHVRFSKSGKLSKQELANIKSALEDSGYWSLPQKDNVMGMDGSQLIIETVKSNKYRVFERWTPSSNAHSRGLEKLVALYTSQFEQFGLWPAHRPNKLSKRTR